jgi:hypothetical protein
MLSAMRLRELLSYAPETGLWTWLIDRGGTARAGTLAGAKDGRGYNQIRIDGSKHRSCRLAVLYMTGEWPAAQVDHIDRDRSNDRWLNLREASSSQNRGNCTVRSDSYLGIKGVHFDKRVKSRPFRAHIRINGKLNHLGCFETAELASAAYAYAATRYFGDFAEA